MKHRILTLIALVGTALSSLAGSTDSILTRFITTHDGQLFDGDKPFRFISWNIPNLHLIEDDFAFGEFKLSGARLPDRFEITDALATVRQMGGQVVRTYVISVVRTNDAAGTPRHVLGPGRFNEAAFRSLDQVFQIANEQGVRLIIPFVDNWWWWGGRAEYAGFRGKTKNDFWTDPQLIADFKQTIHFMLTRTNTLTGVRYEDDPAVLCWETGNELECPHAWTREIAGYIKSLDTNHLVMDGTRTFKLDEESLAMPEVDIVTTHHYPHNKVPFGQMIRENAARAKGRKAYVVGEFGFAETKQMADAIQATLETQTAGALAWTLRSHNRDGGFYWHSEPTGGNRYKSFHWPGSPIGNDYDEMAFMTLMQQQAYAIRGLSVPEIPTPAPPTLLPIADVGAISWQGSVGAASYMVERAPQENGAWKVVGENVDDSSTQYRPLFSDETASKGQWFYRVSAKNAAGSSAPSNVVGPVSVARVTLVDELADFSKAYSHDGGLAIESRDCRWAMEDAHRAGGQPGSELVYRVPSRISEAKVLVFFPKELADLKFSLSTDGKIFRPVTVRRKNFPFVASNYGNWRRAIYELKTAEAGDRFVKIEFTGPAQISRVEIQHAAD